MSIRPTIWLTLSLLLLIPLAGAEEPVSVQTPSKAKALRLVTIGGAVTEIVYALGKGNEIVANDITSYYPPQAQKITKIGYMRTLSAEGLLSMNPTLIIADAGAGPGNVLEQIRSAGVKVLQLHEGHTPQQVAINIRLIGDALQASTTEKVASGYEAAWGNAQSNVAQFTTSPKVLFVMDHTGKNPQAAGDETAADAVISLINGKNVMSGQFSGYRPLTPESVVASAPEVIIATQEGIEASGGVDRFLDKSGLRMTPAGKARNVISMDSLLLLGFTPRLPALVADLSRAIRKTPSAE